MVLLCIVWARSPRWGEGLGALLLVWCFGTWRRGFERWLRDRLLDLGLGGVWGGGNNGR